jgi:hypothetical protein
LTISRSLPPLPNLHRKGKGATEPSAALETLGFVLRNIRSSSPKRTSNAFPGTTLRNVIVEGLSMPMILKEKFKPILAPKG